MKQFTAGLLALVAVLPPLPSVAQSIPQASGTAYKNSAGKLTTIIPPSSGSGTLTLPAANDTLVGRDTNDVLNNKTMGVSVTNWLVGKLSRTVTYNVLNVISKPHALGMFSTFMAAARTSDNTRTDSPKNDIADTCYMVQDNTVIGHLAWCRYSASERTATAIQTSKLFGEENSIKNDGLDAPAVDPYNLAAGANPAGMIIGHRVTSGWGPASHLISSYYNGNWNGGKARSGMVFGVDALDTSSGYAPALAMGPNQGISWYKASGSVAWRQFYNDTAGSGDIILGNSTYQLKLAGGAVTPLNITTTGVGINGQVPAYPLDVAGAVRAPQFLARPGPQTLSACGANPTMAASSSKQGGRFTTGSGTVNSCTLTFDTAFPNASFCAVSAFGNASHTFYVSAQSAASFTVSFTTPAPSTTWQYVCSGN